jgi:hypothetical protein
MYALTGCDTVSAFAGKGKKKTLGLMKNDARVCEVLTELGKVVVSEIAKFVCRLYVDKGESVNEVLQSLQSSHTICHQLKMHYTSIYRANYQAAI